MSEQDGAPGVRYTEKGDPVFMRSARIDDVSVIQGDDGEEDRRVVLSFSSDEPIMRYPWFGEPYYETLGHDDDEVDLFRLNNGASVFYNHASYSPALRLGAVARAWLENGRGYAEVRISNRDEVSGFWQDIKDRILTLISVGYSIHSAVLEEQSDTEPDRYRVTDWEPVELSFVGIPADPTIGVGRGGQAAARGANLDGATLSGAPPLDFFRQLTGGNDAMSGNDDGTGTGTGTGTGAEAGDGDGGNDAARDEQIRAEAARAARQAEGTRQTEIRAAFDPYREDDDFAALERTLLDDPDTTPDKARAALLDLLGKDKESVGGGNGRVTAGEDQRDKFREGLKAVLFSRCDLRIDDRRPDLQGNPWASYRLSEMAREGMRIEGVAFAGSDSMQMVGRAFHSTSDFPQVLGETARASMGIGWEEAPEVFDRFCGRGNLSDFKIHKRLELSSFDNLELVPEGGEFGYGTFVEGGESISLGTYGRIFAITRQAVINDDLDAFSTVPRKQGRAAKRKVGDLVYDHLFANPNMADGIALFHTDHKNIAVTHKKTPDVDSISEADEVMLAQVDAAGNAINVAPKFLLIPGSERLRMRQLITSENDPNNTTEREISNKIRGWVDLADVLHDNRMSNTTARKGAWFALGDPNLYDTIQVAYLNGNDQPTLEEQDGWKIDGVEFKVRIDVGVKAISHRAMYYNPGK